MLVRREGDESEAAFCFMFPGISLWEAFDASQFYPVMSFDCNRGNRARAENGRINGRHCLVLEESVLECRSFSAAVSARVRFYGS